MGGRAEERDKGEPVREKDMKLKKESPDGVSQGEERSWERGGRERENERETERLD